MKTNFLFAVCLALFSAGAQAEPTLSLDQAKKIFKNDQLIAIISASKGAAVRGAASREDWITVADTGQFELVDSLCRTNSIQVIANGPIYCIKTDR